MERSESTARPLAGWFISLALARPVAARVAVRVAVMIVVTEKGQCCGLGFGQLEAE